MSIEKNLIISATALDVVDILNEIFLYLQPNDILNCALVCKKWRQLANNNDLWFHVLTKYILTYTKSQECHMSYWLIYFNIGQDYKNGYLGIINRKYQPLYKKIFREFIFIPQNDTFIQQVDQITRAFFIAYYYFMMIIMIIPIIILFILFDTLNYGLHYICRKQKRICFCRSCYIMLRHNITIHY